MDTLTRAQRSSLMSKVRSAWTGPEKRLYGAMREAGLRPRPHDAQLPGRPDFVFDRQALAVMVEGCFWHKCPAHYKRPKSNVAFWDDKVACNVRRDRRNRRKLAAMGIRVLRVWEHSLRTADSARGVAEAVRRRL